MCRFFPTCRRLLRLENYGAFAGGGPDVLRDDARGSGDAPEDRRDVALGRPGKFSVGRVSVACTRVSSGRELVAPPGTLPGIQSVCADATRVNAGRRTDPEGRPTDPKARQSEGHKARAGDRPGEAATRPGGGG